MSTRFLGRGLRAAAAVVAALGAAPAALAYSETAPASAAVSMDWAGALTAIPPIGVTVVEAGNFLLAHATEQENFPDWPTAPRQKQRSASGEESTAGATTTHLSADVTADDGESQAQGLIGALVDSVAAATVDFRFPYQLDAAVNRAGGVAVARVSASFQFFDKNTFAELGAPIVVEAMLNPLQFGAETLVNVLTLQIAFDPAVNRDFGILNLNVFADAESPAAAPVPIPAAAPLLMFGCLALARRRRR